MGVHWLRAQRTYLALSLPLHLGWEILHLPLYTIWQTGTVSEKAFAVLHCTGGDLIIAALSLVAALLLAGSEEWPSRRTLEVFAVTLLFGMAYTMYSEWLNTTLRKSWTYAPLMPVLPITGTGLSPLLQWVVVPSIALSLATRSSRA